MTDDPIDLSQVAADDAAIEQLRAARFAGDDPAMAMLRDLLHDVGGDLPTSAPLGHGSSQVIPLPNDTTPERRLLRNGTLLAMVTAGALSLGGVAAAATLAPEGSPLHAFGQAVRSAAGAVVGAVTPPQTPDGSSTGSSAGAPAVAPTDLPSASAFDRRTTSDPQTSGSGAAPGSASGTAPGTAVSAAARSEAAARSVAALLDSAEALLDAGRVAAADARLDTAELRLAAVLPADAGPLQARLTGLRERVAAATAKARPAPTPRSEVRSSPKPTPAPQNERTPRPESESAPQGGRSTQTSDAQPGKRDDGGRSRQPSKDASAKPRA